MFLITCLDLSVNQELTLADHIGWLSVSCFHSLQQLRDIRRHRQHLSECCRCQSDLLQCVHNVYLRQLQTVVSATAQLIICKQKYDHISATIWDVLHWLPIHQRVEFLTVHAVFNCLHNLANLSTMCLSVTENPRLGHRYLHSAACCDLVVSVTRTVVTFFTVSLSQDGLSHVALPASIATQLPCSILILS